MEVLRYRAWRSWESFGKVLGTDRPGSQLSQEPSCNEAPERLLRLVCGAHAKKLSSWEFVAGKAKVLLLLELGKTYCSHTKVYLATESKSGLKPAFHSSGSMNYPLLALELNGGV